MADSAARFVPQTNSLAKLQAAAADCQGCDLYRRATQTVFGQGRAKAPLILIGETPGDAEDRAGRPFLGPAGRLLDEALADAGIDRADCYVTNAVKHFKWTPRGKKRLHSKPSSREILACRPWLEAELAILAPQLIVCLGATASQALLGRAFRITKSRGEVATSDSSGWVLATYHPSAVLRAPRPADRHRMRSELVDDLKTACRWLATHVGQANRAMKNQST
ncbi:MAG TPA: UdgX family uracil-DNA binding protein [Pirellulales bacterium]|jgi:DNA polymerase